MPENHMKVTGTDLGKCCINQPLHKHNVQEAAVVLMDKLQYRSQLGAASWLQLYSLVIVTLIDQPYLKIKPNPQWSNVPQL